MTNAVNGDYSWPFGMLAALCVVQLALVPRLRPGRLTEPQE